MDKILSKRVSDFMLFVRQQGVVGLAVGLVMGSAIKSVVDSLVNNILNPVIGLLTGGVNLNEKYVCLAKNAGECTNKMAYGSFISTLISFTAILAVVYFGVRSLKLDKLDISKDVEKGVKRGAAGAAAKAGKK